MDESQACHRCVTFFGDPYPQCLDGVFRCLPAFADSPY